MPSDGTVSAWSSLISYRVFNIDVSVALVICCDMLNEDE
jgi:hypothetical protein